MTISLESNSRRHGRACLQPTNLIDGRPRHVEEEVPEPTPFLDRYRVGDEYPFIKLAGLVEVEGGQPDERKSLRVMC